jgi:hypothetical protein
VVQAITVEVLRHVISGLDLMPAGTRTCQVALVKSSQIPNAIAHHVTTKQTNERASGCSRASHLFFWPFSPAGAAFHEWSAAD